MNQEALESREVPDSVFVVDVDGFEGPLDLLLELARKQRVDLRKISVLRLAEQYAEFVDRAESLKVNLAADYLVMAAWLALIKSRLLLPEEGEEAAEESAARLAFRLQRLNAMREAAKSIMERPQLGMDFFPRGDPELVEVVTKRSVSTTVLDLSIAYARMRSRREFKPFALNRSPIYSVEDATENLRRLLGEIPDWADLAGFLPQDWVREPQKIRSAMASTLAAALELVKRGELEVRQSHSFASIELKRTVEAHDG
ncbi:MAG: ScpA family protein [Rhodobacteraceae bacterium]|nr:ScpA family protein [Paracoccaceae bacterium]